jgi:hypothetical protein
MRAVDALSYYSALAAWHLGETDKFRRIVAALGTVEGDKRIQ